MHKHLPHAANFIPVSKLETLGNIIPGVSIKNTKGSSETLILVSRALVTPGLLPTRSGFPEKKTLVNDTFPFSIHVFIVYHTFDFEIATSDDIDE